MLPFVVLFFAGAWTLALVGYGILFNLLFLPSLPFRETLKKEVVVAIQGILGFVFVACIGLVLNFFIALNGVVSVVLLVGGLLVLALRWNKAFPTFSFTEIAVFLVLGVICLSAALYDVTNADTGLYHLSAINWTQQSRVIPGMANLQTRLGFDSLWFIACAVVEPLRALTMGPHFIANAIVYFLFGSAIFLSIKSLLFDKSRFSLVFLGFCVIPWRLSTSNYVPSGSPDLPILFLTLLCIYLILSFWEDPSGRATNLVLAVAISLFAVTVKLSSVVVLIGAIGVLAVTSLIRTKTSGSSFAWLRCWVFCAVFLVLWICRNVLMSGCLIYPVAFLRIGNLPWVVTLQQVIDEAGWIRSWARAPDQPWQTVLANWNWFGPWLREFVSTFRGAVEPCLLVGVVFLTGRLLREEKPIEVRGFGSTLSIALAGVVFWFAVAPDPRFGAGYIFSFIFVLLARVILLPRWQFRVELREGLVGSVKRGFLLFFERRRKLMWAAVAVLFISGICLSTKIPKTIVTDFAEHYHIIGRLANLAGLIFSVSVGLFICKLSFLLLGGLLLTARSREGSVRFRSKVVTTALVAAFLMVDFFQTFPYSLVLDPPGIPTVPLDEHKMENGLTIYSTNGHMPWDSPILSEITFDSHVVFDVNADAQLVMIRYDQNRR